MSDAAMKLDPSRVAALVSQLQSVNKRILAVAKDRPVRLVAVSKLKPANDIFALHQGPDGHEHFGENYVQELGQKAELLPRSIKWHYIGGLQSGHCKPLARIPNLWCVSSVASIKHAQLLDKHRGELIASWPTSTDASGPSAPAPEKLRVHVQVNTSGEESKSGCSPGSETLQVCRFVATSCPNLSLLGLMTIGAIARSKATTPETENEDFEVLRRERDAVAADLGLAEGEGGGLELSMGMSDDFEGAIAMGSGEVRVGSTIFGERPAKADAKITA